MSKQLSEVTVKAEKLTCEAAIYHAKAMAAQGLQRAEETRAAAAGAEAQALKVWGVLYSCTAVPHCGGGYSGLQRGDVGYV